MKRIRILGYFLLTGDLLGIILSFCLARSVLMVSVTSVLAVLQIVYLACAELMIYRPLRRVEEELNASEKMPAVDELFEDDRDKGPYVRQLEQLIEQYAAQRIRQNNAEIFNKQTELTALQSQINPHFLYNTLDTIRGQALAADDLEAAQMIETLASFFRYSISRKGNMVTLRDELNNINNYMKIQQYRFANRFTMEIVLDEEDQVAYDCYVPRLILQPIVENAIVHGLEDKTEEARIVIEVTVAGDLIITVSDNGKGMSLAELDNLNKRIHSRDMKLLDETRQDQGSTGIALPNINKRIQLLFGKRYGLNVYSSEGCGTDVELIIPAHNRTEELTVEENSSENE